MSIPLSYEFSAEEIQLPQPPKAGEAPIFPIHNPNYDRLERLERDMNSANFDPVLREALQAEKRAIIKQGVQYRKQQKEFAGKRHDEEHEQHAQWQKWQAEAIAENPRFSGLSKSEQAKRLKKKHVITQTVSTIRKRLK